MKTSEDKLNEALRNVLKRKFDDYEEQPNPTALERIRARLKRPGTGSQWWFSGAMVLVIMSGLLVYRHAAKRDVQPSGVAASRVSNSSVSAVPRDNMKVRAEGTTTGWSKAALPPGSRAEHNERAGEHQRPAHRFGLASAPSRPDLRAQTHRSIGTAVPALTDSAADAEVSQAEHAFGAPEMPDATSPANQPDNGLLLTVHELASLALSEVPVPLRPREVTTPAFKPVKAIVTNPAKLAWLVNAAVLHSYQILTVPSSAARDYQNFNFPSLFTARSMGYKVSAGVERKGIQLLLHYSGFRQTYSYEIARNSYLVTPDSKGQYHTVRQGDQIEETREFSMLGLGVAKQVRWGHSPVSRFYAAFGAEYSHDLKSTQSLAWINLGLGKQFALTRHTAFSIGPFAEFSPVKVKGITNPFYYQPYRVGISAGLRFVRP